MGKRLTSIALGLGLSALVALGGCAQNKPSILLNNFGGYLEMRTMSLDKSNIKRVQVEDLTDSKVYDVTSDVSGNLAEERDSNFGKVRTLVGGEMFLMSYQPGNRFPRDHKYRVVVTDKSGKVISSNIE